MDGVVEILSDEYFVHAHVFDGKEFEISISPLVLPDDRGLWPVYDYMSTVCLRLLHQMEASDPNFAGRKRKSSLYAVMPECDESEHLCKNQPEKRGEICLTQDR